MPETLDGPAGWPRGEDIFLGKSESSKEIGMTKKFRVVIKEMGGYMGEVIIEATEASFSGNWVHFTKRVSGKSELDPILRSVLVSSFSVFNVLSVEEVDG